jgi:2-keto-4-pentenoate hydratase
VEEFAFFLERDPLIRQMTEFEALRRTDVVFQTAIEVRLRASNISNAEPA